MIAKGLSPAIPACYNPLLQVTNEIAPQAREAYLATLASPRPWWSAVVITAGSQSQAELYRQQIRHRADRGHLPRNVSWHVVPDPEGHRVGSGGATLLALKTLNRTDPAWWARNRVLIIHAGGESRRLPEYSLTGKLFGILPSQTPWGENSTVFDETLALSTLWLERFSSGLVISSGDVILTFDASGLDWETPGVAGAAIRESPDVGARHGVYVLDEQGRVYSFLQKPTPDQTRAAGGILPGDQVALDIGLLHFDANLSSSLTRLVTALPSLPFLDLYQHFTFALTGESPCPVPELDDLLRGVPFHCSLVDGDFTHVGTTSHFRRLFQGGIVDSILAPGSETGPGALVIECCSSHPIWVGAGAIAHGLTDLSGPVSVHEESVAHEVPVRLPDGRRGFVLRTYGVEDDPKTGAWFGRPILDVIRTLQLDPEDVWPDTIPEHERCLWNARVFLFNNRELPRLSLATSTEYADTEALAEARDRRRDANWRISAVDLARSETDIRPLLLHAPGIAALAETGRTLSAVALELEPSEPSEAASRHYQASLFFNQAGLVTDAARSRDAAFTAVNKAVATRPVAATPNFQRSQRSDQPVTASAPARIDFGGGWSDTPPFCLDWGGTVFNMAITVNGEYPIRTIVRPLQESVIRLISSEATETVACDSLLSSANVGSPFAIHRAAIQMLGFGQQGLEICTHVDLPMGSGLGTSSVLAATVLQALLSLHGERVTPQQLSDLVLSLEQFMTTGGGWQDQVGGIYPGAKLTMTGPGPRQRLRVEPVECPADFVDRFILYYTGIRRIAKDLLAQVVGRYLAREVKTVQVLHSIKTLAVEMAYAMKESDWDYLGSLLDRHWQLNQILDPHTTNAPISKLLDQVRPFISGAKLAGAGGGGFLMLLAKSPEEAQRLRFFLATLPGPGAVYDWAPAPVGLHETR